MTQWFRMYAEAMRNPKIISLSDRDFRTWVRLLSIASENNGKIPSAETCKTLLSMRLDHLLASFQRLVRSGLIDSLGDCYEPHNWNKFQYKSDSSTERVTLHRERKRNNNETPPDTDTDITLAKASDGEPSAGKMVWDDALAYYGTAKRSMIGKWVKTYTVEKFMEVMIACQIEDPLDRIAWTNAALLAKKKSNGRETWCGMELPIT